jgi:hypothetical protein
MPGWWASCQVAGTVCKYNRLSVLHSFEACLGLRLLVVQPAACCWCGGGDWRWSSSGRQGRVDVWWTFHSQSCCWCCSKSINRNEGICARQYDYGIVLSRCSAYLFFGV